jgi:cyclopropane fatty-acyl-phospholipid synthase-like methyltransferase
MRIRVSIRVVLLAIAAAACLWSQSPPSGLAPFVPSPQAVVDKMLEAAHLKPGETIYDLGSGDGRVVITAARRYQAKAVGVELSSELCARARREVRLAGLENQVLILHGDLLGVDLSPADVVTVYLLTHSNERLRPNLEKYLKPGARVVSHDFAIRGWEPVRTERVEAGSRVHTIYLYEIRKKK